MRFVLLSTLLLTTLTAFPQTRAIPHVTRAEGGFTTNLILQNTGPETRSYEFTPFDASGQALSVVTGSIEAGATLTQDAAALLGADAAHFAIFAPDIAVTVAYRAVGPNSAPAHLRDTDLRAQRWRLYPGAWDLVFDGVAMVNFGDETSAVSIRQIGEDGATLATVDLDPIPVNGKSLFVIGSPNDQQFTPVENASFEILSDEPIALTALRGSIGEGPNLLWENAAIPLDPLPSQKRHLETAFQPGPPSDLPIAHGLAKAHVDQRLFGATGDWRGADNQLIELLNQTTTPFSTDFVSRYANAFDELYFSKAAGKTLGQASVRMDGIWAIVKPGAGDIEIPVEAQAIAVDLWNYPAGPDADQALHHIMGALLAQDTVLGEQEVRGFSGWPSQREEPGIYQSYITQKELRLTGSSNRDLPLVMLTGPKMSPVATQIAGGLRLSGKAHLIGYDLMTQIAESTWAPVGDAGIYYRSSRLMRSNGDHWPNDMPSDVRTNQPFSALQNFDHQQAPTPITTTNERPAITEWVSHASDDQDLNRGVMRVIPLILYGTLKRFYPYFEITGDYLDTALSQALGEVAAAEAGDRLEMYRIIGRFMHELYDGHGFYEDPRSPERVLFYLGAQLQQVDGKVLIQQTINTQMGRGDEIIAVDDQPIDELLTESMRRQSAATEHYRRHIAIRMDILQLTQPFRTLGLRSVDGSERTVTIRGVSSGDQFNNLAVGGTMRRSGWLSALGADDVYFLNMGNSRETTTTALNHLRTAAEQARALVVDMRDYPYNLGHYTIARVFHERGFTSPIFKFPTWEGPHDYDIIGESFPLEPYDFQFTKPIVLLVSHSSVSAAENFMQMFAYRDNVTVVGQTSAATNGNTTRISLPAGFWALFTGMEVLNPDGSTLHGVGIQPDVVVTPTAQQFADNIDPELTKALELLQQ